MFSWIKRFFKSEYNYQASRKHHGIGYVGMNEYESVRSAAEIHCGVGYTGFPKG